MKIETSELIGAALDWAVAKCEAEKDVLYCQQQYGRLLVRIAGNHETTDSEWLYSPSTNWAQGGPIIEREKILADFDNGWSFETPWRCAVSINRYDLYDGETLLVAAMRCYVASKLGDVVDIPEELL